MDMRLERATQFCNRSQIIQREARLFAAAIKGEKCSNCPAQATQRVGNDFYCALDARIGRNRARREKLRAR